MKRGTVCRAPFSWVLRFNSASVSWGDDSAMYCLSTPVFLSVNRVCGYKRIHIGNRGANRA